MVKVNALDDMGILKHERASVEVLGQIALVSAFIRLTLQRSSELNMRELADAVMSVGL